MAGGMRILALAAFGLLGACAEQASIYHLRTLPPGQSVAVTVDAKQRSTYAATVDNRLRLCAEAAPDAFSAISASASGDIGAEGLGGPTVSAKAKVAMALAESAGTIERTQTINLLRESMYRTCERWLSGATDRSTFIVQAARDQRAMVAVLAIEQLTRVARRPSTILVAPTTGTSIVNGDEAAKLVTQFNDERVAAGKAADKAKADYETALVKGKCDKLTTAPAADATDPTLTDWTSCVAAKAVLDQRNAELKTASDRLDKGLALTGQGLGSTISSSTGTGTPQNGSGEGAPSDANLTAIAGAVERIADAPAINEAMMFCIAYLSSPAPDRVDQNFDRTTRERCLKVVERRGEAELRFLGFTGGGAATTLSDYMDAPQAVAERARRRELVARALQDLGLSLSPAEVVMFIMTADQSTKNAALARLRDLETDPAARAMLGNP